MGKGEPGASVGASDIPRPRPLPHRAVRMSIIIVFFSFTNVGLPRLAWQILYAILLTSVVGRRPTERVKLTLGRPGGQTI
jgi:hypothetical protein